MAKVIGFIPARKGSKRFPSKNKALYRGIPLWEHAIITALKCEFINEVVISTDDPEILEKALAYPVKVWSRPRQISGDRTDTWEVIDHQMKGYSPSTVIILFQPTSPQRTPIDVLRAWVLYKKHNCPIISAYESDDKHSFIKNGAIYITELGWGSFVPQRYDRHMPRLYLMSKERSVDIDYKEQLEELNDRINNFNVEFNNSTGDPIPWITGPHDPYWYAGSEEECESNGSDDRAD